MWFLRKRETEVPKPTGPITKEHRDTGVLTEEEKFKPEQRRSYQEKFLREVISHAYSSATPLKAAMDKAGVRPDDIRTLDDLPKVPITKKTDLKEAQAKNPPFGGYCTVPINELLRIHQSPGPIYDPVGKVSDYHRWKVAIWAAGVRPGDLAVNTFAYHLTPAGHMFEDGISEIGATVVPTGVGNTETQVQILKDLGATVYVGTPSFFRTIIKRAEDMGVDVKKELKLQVAFLLAEMLPESMRRKIIDHYNWICRQAYGTADIGLVSYECANMNGMHIHYDVIVEIVEPDTGRVLPPGEIGEVVVTVNNRVYPLVRFGTGDLSSISDSFCNCGRFGPRLTGIKGRVDQLTKVKGMFVHPSQVQKAVERFAEVAKARLVVDRRDDADVMTLEVELKGEPREGLVTALEQSLREAAKLRGEVKIVEPGSIPDGAKTIEDVRKWD